MKFRVTASATFNADNITEALIALSEHFEMVAEGIHSSSLIESGSIVVEPETSASS